MGAPKTMLTGTWCGPAHEKLGAVMPTFFRPHLPAAMLPHQLCRAMVLTSSQCDQHDAAAAVISHIGCDANQPSSSRNNGRR